MKRSFVLPRNAILSLILLFPLIVGASNQRTRRQSNQPQTPTPRAKATGSLNVITGRPGSVVFVNNVRHGVSNEQGELKLPRVIAGAYPVRVRTVGYADWNGAVVITPNSSRTLNVTQQPTNDVPTLHYQKGDELRDKGKNRDAVEEYKQALALRPNFVEARIAMARSLVTLQDFLESEKQLQAAIKLGGRTLVEAQTVLANLRRNQGLIDESIVEYRRALRLARGNAFEAHIGLAIALNETVESPPDSRLIDEIAREYRVGIAQDMETEPILYYQLGEILERAGRNKEAIEAYRNYLRLDPEGEFVSAAESIIEQLKQPPEKR